MCHLIVDLSVVSTLQFYIFNSSVRNILTYMNILHLRTSGDLLVCPFGLPSWSGEAVQQGASLPRDNTWWAKGNSYREAFSWNAELGKATEKKNLEIPKHFSQSKWNGLSLDITGFVTNQN